MGNPVVCLIPQEQKKNLILKQKYHLRRDSKKQYNGMKKNSLINKATIVFHEFTTGPGHDLRDFLNKKKVDTILFMSHPNLYVPENKKKSSKYEVYQRGKLTKSYQAYHWVFPEPLLYVKDMVYTLVWSIFISG